MFKSSESPTMEIIDLKDDFKLLYRCLDFSAKNHLQRVIIHVDNCIKGIGELINMMGRYPELMVYFKCSNNEIFQNANNIFLNGNWIVSLEEYDEKLIQEWADIFFEITLTEEMYVEETFPNLENIIWKLKFKSDEWAKYDSIIHKLLDCYKKDIMFSDIILTKSLIREHPCNVYLCSGMQCHSEHGNVPRYITVNKKGELYPYDWLFPNLKMGSIWDDLDEIIAKYNISIEKQNFINANRELYIHNIDKCCYELIPWFDWVKEGLHVY